MCFQTSCCAKTLVTSFAFVQFLSSMGSFMCFQTSCLAKTLVTSFAFVWFLSSVGSCMSFQTSCCAKTLVTTFAFVRFLSCMESFMCLEISCCAKILVTSFAFVWFLSSTHERCHSGEKAYRCETCDKGFNHAVSLYRHKRLHLKQKQHKQTSNTRFSCWICQEEIHSESLLLEHYESHMRVIS